MAWLINLAANSNLNNKGKIMNKLAKLGGVTLACAMVFLAGCNEDKEERNKMANAIIKILTCSSNTRTCSGHCWK